jgi:hypothetical protein
MLEVLLDIGATPWYEHGRLIDEISARHIGLPFYAGRTADGKIDATRITFLPRVERLPDDAYERDWKARYLAEIAA